VAYEALIEVFYMKKLWLLFLDNEPVIPSVIVNEPVISTWLPAAKIKLDLEDWT
jgi:hypothetical protein